MDKAEETIKIIRSNKPYDVKLKALDEYAKEVATEYTKYLKPHVGIHWIKINFNKWFDVWQQKQE